VGTVRGKLDAEAIQPTYDTGDGPNPLQFESASPGPAAPLELKAGFYLCKQIWDHGVAYRMMVVLLKGTPPFLWAEFAVDMKTLEMFEDFDPTAATVEWLGRVDSGIVNLGRKKADAGPS